MLKVENLSKEFTMHIRGGKKIVTLSDISFQVRKGEFLGITGPSGIGKSSLLKCIYRTYLPSGGNIWYLSGEGEMVNLATVDDHKILELRRSEIGYVAQFLHVIPRVSALEVVSSALITQGVEPKAREERAKELFRRLGIPASLWEMYPSSFSGGEKQRLNIIRGLISKPRLLLLDEPTASLDPVSKREVISLIQELKKEGTTMIGVFHDYETLMKLADTQLDINLKKCKEVCV
ncbi:MAG: phnL [Peptococcaceae bacterium]|jgi:alpha-D-ribose 1-methylphosphonate 5-triphosphate synthase subunit PhnL|nr:phnL [Peptococcaceae bacterium]